MWRPEKDWDKETLDKYLIMSGWKPVNMQGALSLVNYVADAMLEALKGETYGKVPKGTTTIHLTFMTQKPYLFILIPDEK